MQPILTVSQAAAMLGLSSGTVRMWCQKQRIPCSRTPGGHYLIARSVIDQFLPPETEEKAEANRDRKKRASKAREACRNL